MAKDTQAKQKLATISDYKNTFKTRQGQRVLWDLMKKSRLLTSTYEDDPYRTAFNEGGRALVLTILDKLKVDMGRLEQMMNEGSKRDEDLFSERVE